MFEFAFMDQLVALHKELKHQIYNHGGYEAFNVSDPKPRNIHKATVRDRLLHHALYRVLYPFFDRTFIADSFSCRKNKGTHKALDRFSAFGCRVSQSNTQTCWILQCDVKKFFASINHDVLVSILQAYIPDKRIMWLLCQIIQSFEVRQGVGLPLGNLTSQLFVNVYMNKFDQFIKHKLKATCYIRYADDFAIFSAEQSKLKEMILPINQFLIKKLQLKLHPRKMSIQTLASGVDFLGWVHFPTHRVLRTTTKRRMIKAVNSGAKEETLQSYLGLLKHGNTHHFQQSILSPCQINDV